jgi:Plasmid encoded RepA protein
LRPTLIDRGWFHFFDEMGLLFRSDYKVSGADVANHRNFVTVREAFYDEIDQHRIPVEHEAVSGLAHGPGVLDFYVWLVWKSWTINGRLARLSILELIRK